MRARQILLSVFAGGLITALAGCGGDSREMPGAERADPAAPAAREEKLTPDAISGPEKAMSAPRGAVASGLLGLPGRKDP